MRKLNPVSVLLCAVVALTIVISPLYAADKTAPNFILFYMDDYSWNQTSFRMMDSEPDSQHSFYETPHLEKLAKRGVRFTNGYCPTPTCTGSRVSIQFGQTSARIQYRFVHDVLSGYQRPNGYSDEIAMGGILKAAGKNYTTAHFGKGAGSAVGKLKDYGYDVTDEYEKYGPNGNGHGNYATVSGARKPLPPDDPKRIFSLTRDAVKFVNENAGERPFFLMVSHYAAHVKHAALQKDIDRFQKKYDALPNKPTDQRELKAFSQQNNVLYGAMVYEADWSLGEIIKAVKEKGELDNTYIIFTADNGSECLPRDENGHYYSGPLQMGKYSTFEGGLRVPFVVAGPGIKAGSQCDVPIVQWDILPTLHDLSGSKAPLPEKVDGGSLRDVFESGNMGKVKRKVPGLVFHFPSYYQPPISVIRIEDYKFMRHMNTGETKLFNMVEDYSEQNNLSKSLPGKSAEMERILLGYINEVDGGDVKEVYAAYLRWVDENEAKNTENYLRKLEKLEKEKPADYAEQKVALEKQQEQKKREYFAKREICKGQMTWPSWYDSAKSTTVNKLGIDKQGRKIDKKQTIKLKQKGKR
jgi:arylsulfatase A-like enzyme